MGASLHYMRNQLWLGVTLAVCAVAGFGQDYKIITLAGGGVPQNVPATSASLGGAIAVATDGAGNLYMTLRPYSAVVRMDSTS